MRERGQVTAEMAIGLLAVLAALLVMRVYTQRAMQGHLFEAGQALSTPADPRDGFTDTARNSSTETIRQQPVGGMVEARLLKTEPAGDIVRYPAEWEEAIVLESLPTGPVPREPAGWRAVLSTSSWNSSQSSNADVTYDNN